MKVYFTASLTGKSIYGENYSRIVDEMARLGCKVGEVVMTSNLEEVQKQSKEKHAAAYKKIRKYIEGADLVAAEMSYSSVAVGYEITTALNLGKQVVLFHVPDHFSPLLEGIRDKNLSIWTYRTDDLEKVVASALKMAKENMDVRFNFFLPKDLSAHLDWAVMNLGVNRSEYVRRLIEGDMKKNRRYRAKNV